MTSFLDVNFLTTTTFQANTVPLNLEGQLPQSTTYIVDYFAQVYEVQGTWMWGKKDERVSASCCILCLAKLHQSCLP